MTSFKNGCKGESFRAFDVPCGLAIDFPLSIFGRIEGIASRPLKRVDPTFIAFKVANPVVYT